MESISRYTRGSIKFARWKISPSLSRTSVFCLKCQAGLGQTFRVSVSRVPTPPMLEEVSAWNWLSCHAGYQKDSRCLFRGPSEECNEACKWGVLPWLWKPGHKSPKVWNRSASGPLQRCLKICFVSHLHYILKLLPPPPILDSFYINWKSLWATKVWLIKGNKMKQ